MCRDWNLKIFYISLFYMFSTLLLVLLNRIDFAEYLKLNLLVLTYWLPSPIQSTIKLEENSNEARFRKKDSRD